MMLLRLLAMMNMIYSIHLSQLYNIMFLFLHLVCLHDNDHAVNNNPIIVLCTHEGIAILETMAPTLNQ